MNWESIFLQVFIGVSIPILVGIIVAFVKPIRELFGLSKKIDSLRDDAKLFKVEQVKQSKEIRSIREGLIGFNSNSPKAITEKGHHILEVSGLKSS